MLHLDQKQERGLWLRVLVTRGCWQGMSNSWVLGVRTPHGSPLDSMSQSTVQSGNIRRCLVGVVGRGWGSGWGAYEGGSLHQVQGCEGCGSPLAVCMGVKDVRGGGGDGRRRAAYTLDSWVRRVWRPVFPWRPA